MQALIAKARQRYHEKLLSNGVLTIGANGVPSNADKSSPLSISIAQGIARRLMASKREKTLGQTVGAQFEQINMEFVEETFTQLKNLRPGKWHIAKLGNRSKIKTSSFAQYEHLDYLTKLSNNDVRLKACMGNDYMVAPDVVVYRDPEPDEIINAQQLVVDETVCGFSSIRESSNPLPILHASISAKWTMRSDRAQNSRTEALNLIRNRKGHLPHIVVVTGEPMPSRIASIALGTGDIDCVYHFALPELVDAVKEAGAEDALEMLNILIEGKRLKDISDLPLDLAV